MRKKYKILFPFSLIYKLIMAIRNFLFDFDILKSKEFPFPVISVGNITVGGTGKTPHILYLIDFLKGRYNLASLSRGYKRKTKDFIIASNVSNSLEIGDEPKLIKQANTNITVAVDTNRVNGINRLIENDKELEIVLLDDAYQHRWVKPSLSILLIDYNRPLDSDYHLPFGNLREGRKQISRANIIIITKTPEEIKPMEQRVIYQNLKLLAYQNLFFTCMKYQNLKNVFDSEIEKQTSNINEDFEILVITGIAAPENMLEYIHTTKASIKHLMYSDHHNFTENDINVIVEKFNKIKGVKKLIITTEKDAMRLNEFDLFSTEIKDKFYYLPIKVEFLNNQESDFRKLIISHLNQNKTLIKKINYNFN